MNCPLSALLPRSSQYETVLHFPTASRIAAVADIHGLEYQKDLTGADSAHHPRGLCAVVKRRSICLLPRIDESRLPGSSNGLRTGFRILARWEGHSPFGTNFISICLNEP